MGLIGDIENKLFELLKKLLAPVLTPLEKLWNIIKSFFTAIIDLIPETITLVTGTIAEINEWRNFKENLNFKTGVIALQSVRDHIADLIQELVTAWNSLVDLFTSGFKMPVKGVQEAVDAVTEVVDAFESFFGKLGLKDALARLGTTLEKAGGKVFEVLALVQAVAEEALKVVRELQNILNAVRDVRQTFQTGEGLFLQQRNPRKTIELADGGTIKIRVGKLHQLS